MGFSFRSSTLPSSAPFEGLSQLIKCSTHEDILVFIHNLQIVALFDTLHPASIQRKVGLDHKFCLLMIVDKSEFPYNLRLHLT